MSWEYRSNGRASGGGIVEPYVFTDEEKKELLSTWGGETQQAARQKKAIGYLTKAESTIKDWKAMVYGSHSLTGVEYRKQVQDYKIAVNGLSKAYNALHNEPYSGINAFTDEVLFLSENKLKRLRRALAKFVPAWQ